MKVESYKIKSWEEEEVGVLIAENEDWILVNHIPVDFVLDGFKLYRKKFVKKRTSGASEKKIKRVLNLRNLKLPVLKDFVFKDVLETLKWSEEKYGLFEFQDKDEDELFYGKIKETQEDAFVIDMIKSNGEIDADYDFEFSLKKIRCITFATDYFDAIVLLMQDEMKNNKPTLYKV